jgi:predicted metal-dependent RNase
MNETFVPTKSGYYHGLYYYLEVENPFSLDLTQLKEYVKYYDRVIKLVVPSNSTSETDFKKYLKELYPDLDYFINPANKRVSLYTNQNIPIEKIFKDTGYYCILKPPNIASVSLFLNKLYKENFNELYTLKNKLVVTDIIRNPQYLLLTPLGGAKEIGRSCYLLTTPYSKLIIDAGIGFTEGHEIPYLNSIYIKNTNEINGIILTHPHLDHIGYIVQLTKKGYKGPVYVTLSCIKLIYITLTDCLKLSKEKNTDIGYTIKDVYNLLKQVVVIPYNHTLRISKDIKIKLLYSCHILGGGMIEITAHNKTWLWTSDFNNSSPGVELIKSLNLKNKQYECVISEGTNLSKDSDFSKLKPTLKSTILEIKNKLGTLVMPVLLYGRGQEVLYNLIMCMQEEINLKIPIFIDSSIDKINDLYKEHITELSRKGLDFLTNSIYKSYYTIITKENMKTVNQTVPKIIIAPSGMLEGGPVLKWVTEYIEDENSIIMLSCYQPKDTLGYYLKNTTEKTVKLVVNGLETNLTIKAKIDSISPYFGAHITKTRLITFLNKTSKQSPIIIHISLNSAVFNTVKKENYRVPNNLETLRLL